MKLLGIKDLRRRAKKTFHLLATTDFQHADRVTQMPALFREISGRCFYIQRKFFTTCETRIRRTGDRAAGKKRSAIPAACEWLADRRDSVSNVAALTLQNAYSRVYGRTHRSVLKSHTSREA